MSIKMIKNKEKMIFLKKWNEMFSNCKLSSKTGNEEEIKVSFLLDNFELMKASYRQRESPGPGPSNYRYKLRKVPQKRLFHHYYDKNMVDTNDVRDADYILPKRRKIIDAKIKAKEKFSNHNELIKKKILNTNSKPMFSNDSINKRLLVRKKVEPSKSMKKSQKPNGTNIVNSVIDLCSDDEDVSIIDPNKDLDHYKNMLSQLKEINVTTSKNKTTNPSANKEKTNDLSLQILQLNYLSECLSYTDGLSKLMNVQNNNLINTLPDQQVAIEPALPKLIENQCDNEIISILSSDDDNSDNLNIPVSSKQCKSLSELRKLNSCNVNDVICKSYLLQPILKIDKCTPNQNKDNSKAKKSKINVNKENFDNESIVVISSDGGENNDSQNNYDTILRLINESNERNNGVIYDTEFSKKFYNKKLSLNTSNFLTENKVAGIYFWITTGLAPCTHKPHESSSLDV